MIHPGPPFMPACMQVVDPAKDSRAGVEVEVNTD